MTPRTRIGLNINTEEMGDIGVVLAYLERHRPATTLAMTIDNDKGMNDKAWALYHVIRKYGGLLTLRVYNENNGNPWHRWHKYQDAVAAAQRYTQGAPGLYFELANEGRPGQKALQTDEAIKGGVARWFADIANECATVGQRITLPAFATGNYELPDLAWWHPLWQAFYDHGNKRDVTGDHYLAFSCHEYGHALPHLHCGGAHWPDIADPVAMFAKTADLQTRRFIAPTAQDIFVNRWKENYLLFRSWWIVQYIRDIIAKDPNWMDMSIWVTECLWDDMGNIRGHKDFPQAALKADQLNGGRKIRGLRASWEYLQTVGDAAGWSGAEVVCATYDWLETVAPKCYRGWNQYSWTYADDWEPDFGMQHMTEVLDLFPQDYLPYPKITPEPDPYKTTIAVLRNMGDGKSVNIRKDADRLSTDRGDIMSGDVIGYIWPPGAGQFLGDVEGNLWVKVRKGDVEGWVHSYYLLLPEMGTPPVEPPVEPEPPIVLPPGYVTRAEYNDLLRRLIVLEARQQHYEDKTDEYLNELAPAIKEAVIRDFTARLNTPVEKVIGKIAS